MANGGLIGAGIIFLGIAIIGYIVPVNDEGWSIPDVTALCNSGMGQLGQAFSGDIVKVCSEYNMMLYGIYGSGLIGIILLIVGSVIPESKSKEKSLTCKYCNFVAMSEPELLKHNSENHLDKSPYVCEHCDFIGITEEILWNHYNDDHSDKKKWKWN
jgi:hypothetical protein